MVYLCGEVRCVSNASSFHGRALAALLALVRGYVVWRRVIIILLPSSFPSDESTNSRLFSQSRGNIVCDVSWMIIFFFFYRSRTDETGFLFYHFGHFVVEIVKIDRREIRFENGQIKLTHLITRNFVIDTNYVNQLVCIAHVRTRVQSV